MKTPRGNSNGTRLGRLLPLPFLCFTVGCLPDDAFLQVFGDNLLLTAAIVIQTISSTFFNGLFGLA